MTKIRLGTCSPASQATPQATMALLERIARRAAGRGVDLLLFPEAFLGSGYPRGEDFGSTIGRRTPAGREAFLNYFKRAVDFGDIVGEAGAGGGAAWVEAGRKAASAGRHDDLPGDGTRQTLERVARETGVFLVVGAIERAGGSLYCAVVYVCPKRGMLGKRRKVQPRLIWAAAGPGSLRAVTAEIKGVRLNLAAAICWENYMPLVRQALYAQNVNLYLAPTADGRDTWLSLARTIGVEGRCFVVTSNMCTTTQQQQQLSGAASASTAAQSSAQPTSQLATEPTPQSGTQSAPQPVVEPLAQRTAPPPAQAPLSPITSAGVTTTIVNGVSVNGKVRRRKKSFVVDEDGNEIVLSCKVIDDGEDGDAGDGSNAIASDAPEPPPLPPFPRLPVDKAWERHKHERRRSSVFDEDDNEIVLCRPIVDGVTTDETIDETADEETKPAKKPLDGANIPAKPTEAGPVMSEAAKGPQKTTPGGSAIVSPFGDVLAGPQWNDSEGIITADVDFDDCIRGRLDIDVGGHYSRNDSFKFHVEGLDLSPLSY